MEIAMQMLNEGERVPVTGDKVNFDDPAEKIALTSKHAWHMRVARYFAFCTDGGLLGSVFTLTDIVSYLAADQMTFEADLKLTEVIAFMLHVRPSDFTIPWPNKPLRRTLMSESILESTFNDRVMQVLLELGYIRRLFKA